MGIVRGTNIIRDGLVYGYDTGYGIADNETTTRFYPGEPTTNEFYGSGSNGNILDHSSGYGGYGTAQTGALDAFGTTENTVYRNTGKMRLGPTGGQDIGTLTNGNTYTFSVYLRHVPGENNVPGSNGFEFDIVDKADSRNYQGTLDSNMTYDWKRFSVTALHNNNSNYHFIDVGTYQGTNVWEWCMPQIEVGSHATPYTRTSRSATASLIDLTRTVNIDVSNASFDSTGQPDFDGTDDRIVSSTGINLSSYTSLTYEGVVKAVGLSSHDRWFSGTVGSTFHNPDLAIGTDGQLRYIFSSGGIDSWYQPTGLTIDTTKFNHLVYTFTNTGTVKIYINGTLEYTGTHSSNATFPNGSRFMTGMRFDNNGEGVDGNIPIAKVYSKALSADEVTQNYNAYKNRFNL